MSSVLKKSAEVLKLQNEYQMEKLRIKEAYDRQVEEEVERWIESNKTVDDRDFLPEMRRHNRRVCAINTKREKHLEILKDILVLNLQVVKIQQEGGVI